MKESKEALLLANALIDAGLPVETEYVFHKCRKWAFDIAFPQILLGIEVNGLGRGGWQGGHQTPQGQQNDMEKSNAAVEAGWRVMSYPASKITVKKDGSPGKRHQNIIDQIERVVCGINRERESAYVLTTDPIDKR
jgi:hypothetical protein